MPEADRRAEVARLLSELIARLEREDLTDLSVTRDDLSVRVRRADRAAQHATAAARAAASALPEREAPEPAPSAEAETVRAPLSGVFYQSSSPQAPAYVQVGSSVSVGQVIGLIEAMKLFNEIRSTASGRVRRILAETGQFVRAQTPLLEVEPVRTVVP